MRVSSGDSRRLRANSATSVPARAPPTTSGATIAAPSGQPGVSQAIWDSTCTRSSRAGADQFRERMPARVVIGAGAVQGEHELAVGERDGRGLGQRRSRGAARAAVSSDRPRRRSGSIIVAAWSADCIACPSLGDHARPAQQPGRGEQRRRDRPADEDSENHLHLAVAE